MIILAQIIEGFSNWFTIPVMIVAVIAGSMLKAGSYREIRRMRKADDRQRRRRK